MTSKSNIISILAENSLYSILDHNLTYISSSTDFLKLIYYTDKELLHISFQDILDIEDEILSQIINQMHRNKIWNGVLKTIAKNKSVKFFDATLYPLFEKESLNQVVVCRKDITDFIKKTNFDQLTGLKNKKSLLADLDKEKNALSIMFLINIDNFRTINEVYGGKTGDVVLTIFSNRLASSFNGYESYRLKDDEFILRKECIHPRKGKNTISKFKKNIHKILNMPISFCNLALESEITMILRATISVSIGENSKILQEVDTALKEAKSQKKHFIRFTNEMNDKAKKEKYLEIIQQIQKSLNENGVIVDYQPIICNKTHKIYKYEALIRLKGQDNKRLMPFEFLELSQQIKLYPQITRAMLQKIFDDIIKHNIKVSCNISMSDILNIKTYNYIVQLLTNETFANNITFEIIETVNIEDYEKFNKFSRTIRSMGAKIAIDDFGTGYSNFSHLSNMEFDYLKIDGQFIKNINTSSKDEHIIKLITGFALKHNIKTIAEFVENEKILSKVKENLVDYSQGYYFSKPLCIEDAVEMANNI